jgi:hypothetical protein
MTVGRKKRVVIGAGVTVGATIAAPGAAQADTFEVTNLLDDGGAGTLRTAIDDANSNPGFDRVLFSSGLSGSLPLTGGDMDIIEGVEVVGPGHQRVTVDGGAIDRIFSIYPAGGPPAGLNKVAITGLTLTGGAVGQDDDGGAIYSVASDLVIEDSVITGNTAATDAGGAIATKYGSLLIDSSVISGNIASEGGGISTKYSTLSVDDSTILGNTATGDGEGGDGEGGGILSALADTVLITDSTLSGNQAPDGGGGAFAAFGSSTLLSNSTVSGNSAEGGAGVLAVNYDYEDTASKFTARNSTITQNTASEYGGGLIGPGDTPVFSTNSIIAGNTAPDAPNIGGDIDAAFTLVNDPADATINETTPGSNLIGAAPQLGPLASNGGPTQTHALLEGSPAIDAGNGTGSGHDQRSQARPVDLAGVPNSTAPGADGSDMGAYELQGTPEGALCRGQVATIVAAPGVPTQGTEGGDVIVGTEGADQIDGRGGGDLICGWGGNDSIAGGAANDTVLGHLGADSLTGDDGRDRLGGGEGEDEVDGGAGRDGLIGGPANDDLSGGGGADRIFGKTGNDTMFGNGGPDRLRGGPGADRFNGGPGRNVLFLIRGDGDSLFGDNADSRVVIRDRPKRKLPPS